MRPRVPQACLAFFVTLWVLLAVAPLDRATWALENIPTGIAVPLAIVTFRRFRFSDRAYVRATLFLLLHTIGSHYTYSTTPPGVWLQLALGLSRNHYDRIVHAAFGVLMLTPTRELFFRAPAMVPFGRQLGISIGLIAAWGAGYEILEWLTAIVADPASGTAFLGTQGDPWDAQKDLLAACSGSVVGAFLERHKSPGPGGPEAPAPRTSRSQYEPAATAPHTPVASAHSPR